MAPSTEQSRRATSSSAARALQDAIAGRRSSRSWRRTGGLIVALLGGAFLAALLVPPDPLRPTRQERVLAVPQKESPQRQYFYAMHVNTEEAWQAVLEYFPVSGERANEVNRLYNLRAKQQLARWYLAHDRPERARALIGELSNLDETDREFQLFGLAWQAIMAADAGDTERASSILTDIWDDRDELDEETRDRLAQLQKRLLGGPLTASPLGRLSPGAPAWSQRGQTAGRPS